MKDWTGNYNSIYKTLGASSHAKEERQNLDYYATSAEATEWLLQLEKFYGSIWEPACGEGHMSEVLKKSGEGVISTDLIDRGYSYAKGGIDFLQQAEMPEGCKNIITNPPYAFAQKFVEHSLELIPEDGKVAMFLKTLFLESQGRRKMFDKNPPVRIWVSSKRLSCAKNGDFEKYKDSAVSYSWFIWEKSNEENYSELRWFN